ncbi:MAG: GFA family protein [Allosphingosinicella sp.]
MTERIASCGCGALTATAEGEPVRNSLCHCRDCKRRTGGAFSWNATYPAAQVTIDGPYASWERGSDEGYWARNHFCPKCGITIFYEIERRPGMISIPVGAFADPDFPAPTVEVYEQKRCGWVPALAAEKG